MAALRAAARSRTAAAPRESRAVAHRLRGARRAARPGPRWIVQADVDGSFRPREDDAVARDCLDGASGDRVALTVTSDPLGDRILQIGDRGAFPDDDTVEVRLRQGGDGRDRGRRRFAARRTEQIARSNDRVRRRAWRRFPRGRGRGRACSGWTWSCGLRAGPRGPRGADHQRHEEDAGDEQHQVDGQELLGHGPSHAR